ncbi:uncharacterized protein JCM10292_006024 [Rhodotorula paludigena]|uniref:uncharacterized protein n=1 Tax=Rhodotorula paludigena TaxID=86838 RepID=UPI0031816BC8
MPGNLRLLLWGLVLGLLSAFYPRLSTYLPASVSSRLPFLPLSSADLASPVGKRWAGTFHRYQQSVPLSQGYEHSRDAEWEALVEQQLRFGSKEGGRELEKEYRRQLREVERRAEHAGAENHIKETLPVYFVEQGDSVDASALERIGDEINALRPQSVILLVPHKTSTSHVLVSTSSTISSDSSPPLAFPSNPRLASHLLRTFAHLAPSGVPAAGSSLISLSPKTARVFSQLGLNSDLELVQVALPVLPNKQDGWPAERWWDVGRALHSLLHEVKREEFERMPGVKEKREEYRNVVVLALGSAKPKNAPEVFPALLESALAHHTSHARELSLHSLYSSTSGSKPQRAVRADNVALYAAVAAAGEGEGEQLGGRDAIGWRLGHLPVR